jgi:hypothetical protein
MVDVVAMTLNFLPTFVVYNLPNEDKNDSGVVCNLASEVGWLDQELASNFC